MGNMENKEERKGCPGAYGLPEYDPMDCGANTCESCWQQAVKEKKEVKRIKIFPAPHIELRIFVSDQMIEDYRKCEAIAKRPDDTFADCDKCSWKESTIGCTGMCELIDADMLR